MADLLHILKKYWGHESFRPQQEAIIQSVLSGTDTLALLPTGGGKSVCYQVPALAQDGICLVISPLIALMKDQVEALKKKGIGAQVIYSGMAHRDIVRTLENARDDYFKFLYVSPERLETSLFLEYLPAFNINLIAVDEAHCISQWGYDFRPSYLKIAALREELPDVPILAVTASATADVQADICDKLLMKKPAVFRQPFRRENLSYSVFHVDSKMSKLVQIAGRVKGTGIVYCKSRKRTTEIASLLQMHGFAATAYHAGLGTEERNKRQQAWIENKISIMVCTNAFGMGIDKADVRFVVHMDAPDCLENYYQEAGRCGRDGKKAYAVLLCDDKDVAELQELHVNRYPTFDVIQQVYGALVNFLQIPVYQGEDQRFVFQFETFIQNFKLNAQQALYSLKALEQDGWLEFNEKNFMPSTVSFQTSKEGLYEFYRSHPQYENMATTLLRTYDGIFDFPAFISENLLSRLLKLPVDEVKKQLIAMQAFHIIRYEPQNDAPFIRFRKNRVKAEELRMDLKAFEIRKQRFISRVQQMVKYTSTGQCRSNFIGQYFGDAENQPCGICDNCLQQRKVELSSPEFQSISRAIKEKLRQQHRTADELVNDLLPIAREKTWKVLAYLQSENSVKADLSGKLKS
ncbi:MAG: RecQ family ATP-dependent DNA helicase [Flavisolibacter sp.]